MKDHKGPWEVLGITRRQTLAGLATAAAAIALPFSIASAAARDSMLRLDNKDRLAVTTVSFRERYAMRLGGQLTPGTDSYLNAPKFVKDNFGLSNLEVWSIQFEEESADYCRRLRAAADAEGVRIINIQLDGVYDLSSADAEQRTASIAFVKGWIDRARLLGAPSLRANLGGMQTVGEFPLGRVLDSFQQLVAYGRSAGVKVMVENHGGHSVNIDNVVSVLEALNDPWCRAIADWGNSPAASLDDRITQITKLTPWLDIISAKAAAFDADYHVKDYDIGALTRAMEQSGFQGLYSVELFTMSEPPADPVRACQSVLASVDASISSASGAL